METLKELYVSLEDLKLVHKGQLSDLKPLLGIDGDSYFTSLLQEDLYSQVLGGANSSIFKITFALRKFKEKGITPVFFFTGVPLSLETSGISKRYKRSQKLWEKINKNQGLDIEKILAKQDWSSVENLREIFRIIRNEGGEVIKCPSYPGFQLMHLDKSLCGVMGCLDLLAFGLNKVVTSIDYDSNTYTYVIASEVWQGLKVNIKRFTEILVAKGQWTGKKVTKTAAIDLVQDFNIPAADLHDIEKFAGLIESEFYLCKDTEKVHFKPIPEIQALIPTKWPEHLYYALCLLPLSSGIISSYLKKVDAMTPPIADSLKYKTLVSKYKPLMRKVYSVLNMLFDNSAPGALKGIKVYYWYDSIQPFQLDFEAVKEINFSQILNHFESSQGVCDSLQSAAKFHVHLWQEHKGVLASAVQPAESFRINSVESLKLKIFLKIFHCIGFINQNFEPTLLEWVLTLPNSSFGTQIFLLLELLKLGFLDWKPMTLIKLPESILKKIAPDKSDLSLFISRVCSLIPATLNNDVWTSNVDHDLSQFYSITSYISKVHQYLAEVFLLEEFVLGRVEISLKSVSEYLAQLQPVPLCSVIVGIIVKKVLEGKKIQEISKEIPQAINIEADLERAWQLWKEFVNILWMLTKETDDVRGVVDQASKLFKTSLIEAGIHVI